MYFNQIRDDRYGCASYVIAGSSGETAIVDPSIRTEQYAAVIRERGLRLRYVIDTHVHADHISGARELAAAYDAELCMHALSPATYPFTALRDGDELPIGDLRLRIVHTPGHRRELISVLVVNPPRSPEASMVLTADSLLVGDVGRPDFGGGDAAAQYDSLTRLLRLPDWVAVFPGHFEGPCGKGMCGRPSTTIGFERLYNPLARLSRSEFIDSLTSEIPPRPLNMTAVEATNRGVADLKWAMLTSSPDVLEVAPESVPMGDAYVIDVREPEEFAGGHVPGAVNMPQADLASSLSSLDRERRIWVVCMGGMRSLRAAQFLIQNGFPDVVSIKDGTSGWQEAGLPLEAEADAPEHRYRETEWAHAGGFDYAI